MIFEINKKYDVVVVGGGPTGMMAAGRAAECGASVLLLEKNPGLGAKLLITGKGRCNITNEELDTRKFINSFGVNGKFLYSAIHKLNNIDIVNFLHDRMVETKVERGGRVFPVSDSSRDVLQALLDYMKEGGVDVATGVRVDSFAVRDGNINKLILGDGREIIAQSYIICTGGKSYPATGSVGDGYHWLKAMGHSIVPPKPSLVPVVLQESYICDLEGLSLKNIEISIYQGGKKQDSRFGEAIFTKNGMSGPIILDMSKHIGELLFGSSDELLIKLDLKPALSFSELDTRLLNDFSDNSNKIFKNSLDRLLPKKMIPVMIKLSQIDSEKQVNSITKEERKKLLHLLKEMKFKVVSLDGFRKAIITSGGVELSEIDPASMKSKIIDNLYVAGEVLDLDGPTGGYNLQVCWSTGYLAGEKAVVFSK